MPHAIRKKQSPPDKPGTFAQKIAAAAGKPGLDRELADWLRRLAAGDSAAGSVRQSQAKT